MFAPTLLCWRVQPAPRGIFWDTGTGQTLTSSENAAEIRSLCFWVTPTWMPGPFLTVQLWGICSVSQSLHFPICEIGQGIMSAPGGCRRRMANVSGGARRLVHGRGAGAAHLEPCHAGYLTPQRGCTPILEGSQGKIRPSALVWGGPWVYRLLAF